MAGKKVSAGGSAGGSGSGPFAGGGLKMGKHSRLNKTKKPSDEKRNKNELYFRDECYCRRAIARAFFPLFGEVKREDEREKTNCRKPNGAGNEFTSLLPTVIRRKTPSFFS